MITERVDDIPLIIAELEKSNLSGLFNEYFPDHGNWSGASIGKIAVGFLTYILSCNDHRLSHVEDWASERIETLRICLGCPNLTAKDFTDDKLGDIIDKFSNLNKWHAFEHAHNKRLINVHDLSVESEPIRLDAMITQSHREADEDFKYGHSKQHRADLPQLKTMVATLDPLAMPLFSLTVPGNRADDELYLPVIEELIKGLDLKKQLFVADAKMGSLNNRTQIHVNGQYYLTPLCKKQCSAAELAAYLTEKPADLVTITKEDKSGQVEIKAQGYEVVVNIENNDLGVCWKERRTIIHSPAYAASQQRGLEKRIDKASKALGSILISKQGRKKIKTRPELEQMVAVILKKHKVSDLIEVQIKEETETKTVRQHLDNPSRTKEISTFSLEFEVDTKVKEQKISQLGWRAYACNAPIERLSTKDVMICYRNEYKIEHKFDELLNRITALMPLYLHKPNRIKALTRLLLFALKYVSLIEYQVRNELETTKQNVKELYPGNPTRATNKPTTSMILRAFRNITLVITLVGDKTVVRISNLNAIQLKLIELLKISPETYLKFNQLLI